LKTLDALAALPHFAEHLAAVWEALPEEARGRILVWDDRAEDALLTRGITPIKVPDDRDHKGRPHPRLPFGPGDKVLAASSGDLHRIVARGAEGALMTHGYGQSYGGRPGMGARHSSYAGGRGRPASLFLHAGGHPAFRDRQMYPKARVEIVGSPRLDTLPKREGTPGKIVAVATHNCFPSVAQETHSAILCDHNSWHGIREALADLSKRYEVIGHAHPRWIDRVSRELWEPLGIETVRTLDEVCRRADVLVHDNSSAIYEFANTNRPVVLLDPPWYDREVGHGLRFWSASQVGLHVRRPGELADVVTSALKDGGSQWRDRNEALDQVYTYRDNAAARAAVVLMDWLAEK
jgi:hypothetical protein